MCVMCAYVTTTIITDAYTDVCGLGAADGFRIHNVYIGAMWTRNCFLLFATIILLLRLGNALSERGGWRIIYVDIMIIIDNRCTLLIHAVLWLMTTGADRRSAGMSLCRSVRRVSKFRSVVVHFVGIIRRIGVLATS